MELVGAIAVGLSRLFGRVDADGLENLPANGPAIVAINHTTIADVVPVLATLHRAGLRPSQPCGDADCGENHGHVRFLVARQVFAHPILGPLARQAGMIEVGVREAANAALKAAREALGGGEVVGIYPEGDVSASLDGSPRRFRLGVGRLALETQAPVIPVAHHDSRKIGGGSIPRSLAGALTSIVRRPTVRLRVGRPMLPEEFAGLPVRDIADLVQQRVTDVWRSIASDVPAAMTPALPENPL